jgi:hypothetical protein
MKKGGELTRLAAEAEESKIFKVTEAEVMV